MMDDTCKDLRRQRSPGMGDEEVECEALDILHSAQVPPRLVVFDLDQTLWPFFCHSGLRRECVRLFPQARGILNALKEKGIIMALASRNSTPDAVNSLLQKLGLISLFVDMENFPSLTYKTEHFQNIKQKTGVPFSSMLFFDDEDRNIDAVSKMGATCVLVYDSLNMEALKNGLRSFVNSVERDGSIQVHCKA